MRSTSILTALLLALVPVGQAPAQCFRRADSNCDGRTDISDGVHTLNWLFLGGPAPCCIDVADSDDDGAVVITDPIYSLNFLFLGGPRPGEPFPQCGRDTTQDRLECLDYPHCPQTLDCFASNTAPRLAPIADATVTAGEEFLLEADASDPDEGDVLVFSLLLAPTGMSLSPDSGRLRWMPREDQVGEHDITVAVEDARGAADFESFIVLVRLPNSAPQATDDSYVTRFCETLSVSASGVIENDSDPNGDALQVELVRGPSNGALDLHPDGSFTYTPSRPGFEGNARRRAVNENLTLLAAPELAVSSQGIQCPSRGCDAEAAADGELGTSWLSVAGDAAPFYEVVFEDEDVAVREVRIFGNREAPAGFDVLEGVVRIFGRGGNELFSSGTVAFPDSDRDLVVPVGILEGVYRVRLSITSKEADRTGISEMEVIGDGTVRSLEVKLKWAWERTTVQPNYTTVFSTPAVIDLDGDGMPEVVFPAGVGLANRGELRALRGSDGSEVFTTTTPPPCEYVHVDRVRRPRRGCAARDPCVLRPERQKDPGLWI